MIKLGPARIPLDQYASQGNAILGIRGSGKTYTATWLAEQLLVAGIPFVAFDPIGIWRYLKVPGAGQGFKVVVAGENADLPLTADTAPEIVRAAMRQNIPLILDLYSMRLSKSDWKKIVETAIRLLLYENKDCGLRHIFIEEAAEFCPQRVGPDQGRVYAEIEKLARMGGNASLGFTLINQRAEEVNKAVLELCDCLFLHRQKGRNSLTALEKWLSFADHRDSKTRQSADITKSLPTLSAGQCWVWTEGSDVPKLVSIPEKQSFHPDRRNPATAKAAKSPTDVGAFVNQLRSALGTAQEKVNQEDPAYLRSRIKELEKRVAAAEAKAQAMKPQPTVSPSVLVAFERIAKEAKSAIDALTPAAPTVAQSISSRTIAPHALPQPRIQPVVDQSGPLQGGAKRMLIALAQRPQGLTRVQLGVRAGLAHSSGTFATYLSKLRSLGYISDFGKGMAITEAGREALGSFTPLPSGRQLFDYWASQLNGGAARMLQTLYDAYPQQITAEDLGNAAGIAHTSGTFATYLSKLRSLELVTGDRNNLQATPEFFEQAIAA
ncbi:MAG TPA: hypothetical protein VEH27_00730 [Methylomirabilota bacterium]|nr:hypothetical protein [Methylomirabilota bacterium]